MTPTETPARRQPDELRELGSWLAASAYSSSNPNQCACGGLPVAVFSTGHTGGCDGRTRAQKLARIAELIAGGRWNRLRDHITQERAAQDQLAGDHEESGHGWQTERAYGRVEALDRLLAVMDELEAGR